jgi:hypothetical protein
MLEQRIDEQSCHWYAYEVGLPVHEPALAASVLPSCGVPLIVGALVFRGGSVGSAGTLPVDEFVCVPVVVGPAVGLAEVVGELVLAVDPVPVGKAVT